VADIARITEIWTDCRGRFGAGGPYLFGAWSLADVFYAPVVSRFRTYDVEVDPACRAYIEAVWARPEIGEWAEGARAETTTAPHYDL
jgi:glutathione S-transferase